MRYFRLAEQRQRPALAARVCDHGYGAEPHPGRLRAAILIFRCPTAQRLTRLRHRRLGSTIRAIPRLGLQGAQPLNQLTALGPPRVRDAGPVLGGLDPHPALP